ncbi:AraC family transcriptional regulator [Sinimarinibacterium sp. CAU 1509]|uniref:AraC family transcriptional regulator n=1 Tax=Sinimarinibacterium sp. CAU 1509 TaxID=2562283 RepID=UPI0010AB56EC|nr:AraC family transcriptional regulator [Sinimarinibacterium sp. CAU 1509]TJY60844.1 AraC family transcriptional regulator [Sinimarinibacterium sp. CAU 1509]
MSKPMHHQPLPFITLPNWVKAATVCGFNIQPIFDRYAVPTDLIHLEDATITAPQLGLVMEDCVAAARSQHFPFVLGDTFAFDYLPDIGTFLATSPSLRQAMHVFVWVRELINPMIEFRLEETGDTAALVLVGGNGSMTPQDRYFIESIFAAVAKFGRMLAADIEPFTRLRFRYAQPSYVRAYAEFFRVPVTFDQLDNALEIPQARLDRPLDGAFPSLHQQAERRVLQRLAQMPPRTTGLVAAIEAAFEQEPKLLKLGIDAVSRRLGLHARTLQRRLGDERQAYGAIRDRVRYRLALRALQNAQADLEAISEQLGFSDRRSFTRAFTRWAGVSPSGFRDRRSG